MLTACSSGDFESGPPRPATTTTVREVVVRGVVGVYSPSARVVTLAQPVNGITNIVLAADAELVRATGAKATPGDLVPRAMVEVTGRPSSMADSLVARRLVLL